MSKKILITGEHSYIGNQLSKWLNEYEKDYEVVKQSVRNGKWKEIDFSSFDTIVHIAGIAHMKENKENMKLYYEINRDLTINIALKAKEQRVKNFIFISSMSVYGKKNGVIDSSSKLEPRSAYGKSKLQAELILKKLQSEDFLVSIVRPPMVYGKECEGNYQHLSKFAKKTFLFPNVYNKRSMIFIDHLSEFIRLLIKNEECGVFFPQNHEYVCTSSLVKNIAIANNKKIYFTKIFNFLIIKLAKSPNVFNKIFGDLYYDKKLSEYKSNYCLYSFSDTIIKSEK